MNIELEDGKYTLIHDDKHLRALRHGEPWRDLIGDKFVYALGTRIEELEAERATLIEALQGPYNTNLNFLGWIADRLEKVYGESPNVDFVLSLRERIALIRTALASVLDPDDTGARDTAAPVSAQQEPEVVRLCRMIINEVLHGDDENLYFDLITRLMELHLEKFKEVELEAREEAEKLG